MIHFHGDNHKINRADFFFFLQSELKSVVPNHVHYPSPEVCWSNKVLPSAGNVNGNCIRLARLDNSNQRWRDIFFTAAHFEEINIVRELIAKLEGVDETV